MNPVLASEEMILPPSLYYLEPMHYMQNTLPNTDTFMDRQIFYHELSQLVGKEVAIKKQEATDGNAMYLTSRGRKKTSMSKRIHRSVYDEEKEYFILESGDTDGFLLKTVAKKKGKKAMYLYWSENTAEAQAMIGPESNIVDIKKLPLLFSDKPKMACEWVFDPNLASELPSDLGDQGLSGGNRFSPHGANSDSRE